jgi:GNAT superfamily N-acetyltransferase
MVNLRAFREGDLDALYAISLATGLAGGDASHLHGDGRLIGHIYSAPYALLRPGIVLVAEDAQGVAGYVAGVTDTAAWEERLEEAWWPRLRQAYPDPTGLARETLTADQRRAYGIHHPVRTPAAITGPYPGHIHMNLLPRQQGRGVGRRLLRVWLEAALPDGRGAFHVGVNGGNSGGLAFWTAQGFSRLDLPGLETGRTVVMGRKLGP